MREPTARAEQTKRRSCSHQCTRDCSDSGRARASRTGCRALAARSLASSILKAHSFGKNPRRQGRPRQHARARALPGILALGACLLLSCHRAETDVERGDRLQILHKGNGQEVQDLDPQIVNSVSSLNIISALLEGLVSEDPHDLHPVPGVAESWDISPDEKIYTFHLRHNAKWSNGDPVVAQNFAESYHRILSPALASPVAYMLYPVVNAEAFNKGKIDNFEKVGFRVLDDWTLQITLTNPTPYFLSLLNHYSWFPVPISTIQKYGPVLERGSRWTKP